MKRLLLQFDGAVVSLPPNPEHPNRHGFKGDLILVDVPTVNAPGGASGHRIMMPKAFAKAHLEDLEGMPVNVAPELTEHDVASKVGIITSARIGKADLADADAIKVKGHLWARDFPAEVGIVRAMKDQLGMSLEMADWDAEDRNADVWKIASGHYTGAAILRQDKAAEPRTRLEAHKESEMNEQEIKALIASELKAGLKAALDEMKPEIFSASKEGATQAAEAHFTALEAERKMKSKGKSKGGNGTGDDGDGDETMNAATLATAIAEANKPILEALGKLTAGGGNGKDAPPANPEVKALQEKLAAQEAKIADLQAAAAKAGDERRATVSPATRLFLSKDDLSKKVGENGKYSLPVLDAAFKNQHLNPEQSAAIKNELVINGLLD